MAHTPKIRQFIRTLQKAQRENCRAEGKSPPLTKEQARWSRRRLLKLAALATGTALATNALPHSKRAWSRDRRNPKIAIIGGGIAGLNAAYQLKKAGLTASVYEARQRRLGGRILSVTGAVGEGLTIDPGGHFINTDHVDILELATEFGLELFNRAEDAERFPFPETAYYFNGIRSEAEVAKELRLLAGQISSDADLLEEDYDKFAPGFDRLSVADYLDQHADKIPEPFIRVLIEDTIRTEYGVEPDQSSALQLLFMLPTVDGNKVEVLSDSDETYVVEGGNGRIIDRLAQELSGQIFLDRHLTEIQLKDSVFHLTFSGNHTVNADYVIIAIPFTVLRDVEIQVDLPEKLTSFINEANLGSNEKLYAGFNQKLWRRENGFVQEVWTDWGFSQAWDETQRQVKRTDGALTFFLGGNQAIAVQSGSPKLQGRKFVDLFENVIPGAKKATNGKFFRTQWTKDPLTKGAYSSFKPGQITDFADFRYVESKDPKKRKDVNVGNLIFAGEHLSDEFGGYMNGAAQTGRLAAEVVLESIKKYDSNLI